MRSLERIVALIATMFVGLSVRLSYGALQCRLEFLVGYSNVLCTPTRKCVHLLPAVFFQFYLEERWGMDVQTRRDISRIVEDRG